MADFLRGRVWTEAAPGRRHGMAPPPEQSQVQDQPEIQKINIKLERFSPGGHRVEAES